MGLENTALTLDALPGGVAPARRATDV